MTPLDRLNADLASARQSADREGSDRHSNPGRALRDMRRQSRAQADVVRLEQAITVASELDSQNVAWTLDAAGRVSFLFADGASFPAASGEGLDQQVALLRSAPSPFEARRVLTVCALDPHASHDLKWVRERLAGSSTPKFRTTFLAQAGLLEDGVLTALGHETGFFHQHDGEYGPYVTATAKGIAWIYAAYLAGNVPITAAARKLAPQRDIELDEILAIVGVAPDLALELAALAGTSAR